MSHPRVRLAPLTLAIALAVPASALMSAPAHAQTPDAAVPIALPAQALGTALNELARQAKLQLMVHPDLVSGRQAPAVSGTMTARQALDTLLSGSGLAAEIRGDEVIVRAAPAGDGASMAPVTISGKAPGSTTEGTGSYTTWSTSSSTRLNLTPLETPQAITVITRQRIDDQGLVSLNDVLEATSGVTVKPFSVGGDGPQIWARGASITNFQIDGVPVSTSMSNYLQSTVIYDRLEIVKGATGMMSGLGTPAATINMIRKRPGKAPMASVSVEAGNWSRYGVGADISRPLNADASVRGRLVVDLKRQGAWTPNYRQEYGVIYGIGEVDLGPRTLLTAGFTHLTRNTDAQIRTFPVVYSNGQPTGAGITAGAPPDWTYYDHQTSSVFSSLEHRFGSGWSAKAELTHGRYKYDAVMATLGGVFNQGGGAGAYALMPWWVSDTEQTSLDAYFTGPFSLFGRRHELIGGVNLSRVSSDGVSYPTARQDVSDIFNWASGLTRPSLTATGATSTREYVFGAYLSSRLQLSDHLSMLLGARITNWKRERETLTYATQASTHLSNREDHVLIPYAGLVYALNDTYALYGSYTKIFRPQDAGTLSFTPGGQMAPEEGVSYEAGIKGSFLDGALTSSLSVYRTQQDNLAVWNAASFAYEAANNATTEGFEVELNGRLAEGWQLSAGYNYGETRNQLDQRILPRVPRNTFKLFTSYRLPRDWNKLTLGGGVRWESKTGDPMTTYTQYSYALVNLMARYQMSKQLAVTAHLNNAFNRRYAMAVAGNIAIDGAPRNFMVSMRYSFQ